MARTTIMPCVEYVRRLSEVREELATAARLVESLEPKDGAQWRNVAELEEVKAALVSLNRYMVAVMADRASEES